jgi:hypothetical protein
MKFFVSSRIGYYVMKKCRGCGDETKKAYRLLHLPNPAPPCSSAALPKRYRVNKYVWDRFQYSLNEDRTETVFAGADSLLLCQCGLVPYKYVQVPSF